MNKGAASRQAVKVPQRNRKSGFDQLETYKELERLRGVSLLTLESVQMVQALEFALHRHHLDDLCVFTGSSKFAGYLEPGTGEVAQALQEVAFGPFPKTFIPTVDLGWRDVPGGDSLCAPGSITYPASALLYAARMGLPLINDDPSLPIPAVGNARDNTKLLATILAFECVRLVLPKLPVLAPRDLADVRKLARDELRPFRLALLRLAGELNGLITSDMSIAEVQRAAKSLAETKVYPELQELRRALEDPGKPWHKRALGLFKDIPDLVQSFVTMPTNIAIAKVLTRLTGVLTDMRDEQGGREALKRSSFYYLLRLPEVIGSR